MSIMFSRNVNVMLNDDCMHFNSDFFVVLFTHCVMVANKDVLLTAVYCMQLLCLFCTQFLILSKDVTLNKHKLLFLVFQLNYLCRVYKVRVLRNCMYAGQQFLARYAILETLLDLYDIYVTLFSSDCQNQMCLKLSSFLY